MKKGLNITGIFLLLFTLSGFAQKPGWHLLNKDTDGIYGIGLAKAYELLKGKTPSTVVVAILDGGIDTLHEDLKKNLWRNVKESWGAADLDGNGYKGDVLGWNFLGGVNGQVTDDSQEYQRIYHSYKSIFAGISDEKQVRKKQRELYRHWLISKSLLKKTDSVAPVNFRGKLVFDNEADSKDRYYGNSNLLGDPYMHGTHVAGIVGALRNNDKGMDGIADAVKLMGIRAVPNGDEHDKDIALGIRYAVDNGAHIINMSFGKPVSADRKMVEDAIRYAEKKGVLLIKAAGNDHKNVDSLPAYPTAVYMKNGKMAANVITVGASAPGEGALVAPFSNYGKNTVDVFAPGLGIYAPVPDNKYRSLSGTSMASPVVAGVAALLKSYYPKLSAKDIKKIIEESARRITIPVTNPKTKQKTQLSELCRTGAIVDAYAAVKMAETYK